ncbi:MAG: SIMPL domain-containing protein, partial [Chloroflexota bacterium]|nr:SIMPL domain-containing protein [Chloroflexota bacterium]MDE2969242.1 SIMPL domain-containing protein [Chloroflexota bacterium]
MHFSRAILLLAAVALILATVACEDDEPEPVPVEPTAVAEQPKDDDDEKKDDDYRGKDGSDAAMELGPEGMALAMQFLEAFSDIDVDDDDEAPARSGVIGDAQDAGVWVNGVGVVSAAPDLAELDLGVSATASTVSDARDVAAEAMTAIVAHFIASGVAPADIRTRRISIQPQYDWQERIEEGVRRSERVLTGYQVSNTAIVLVRDLDRASELIDGAVAAGGDAVRVNGISFRIEDTTELAKEAREMAVADALARAGELASYSGVVLGRMVFLSEVSAPSPVFAERALASLAADASVSTPVSPGEQEVRVTVLAVFDIQGS